MRRAARTASRPTRTWSTAEPERIADALVSGALGADDLTARGLGAFLGKTTGHVYHQWGSLGGLLFLVSKAGFARLAARLAEVTAKKGSLASLAATFVEFGLDHPALYQLMFEHPFDWADLRQSGLLADGLVGLELWRQLAATLGDERARLLYAGLHGLVSLARSGRANIGQVSSSDRAVAVKAARALARLTARAG